MGWRIFRYLTNQPTTMIGPIADPDDANDDTTLEGICEVGIRQSGELDSYWRSGVVVECDEGSTDAKVSVDQDPRKAPSSIHAWSLKACFPAKSSERLLIANLGTSPCSFLLFCIETMAYCVHLFGRRGPVRGKWRSP